MQILALDTSTAWLSVAVFDGRSAIVVRERAGTASSERLLPLTAQVLTEAATGVDRLAGIAYGAGPGSFTGVRIACGVVQGLAFGAELPVFGVSSLAAIAQTAWRTRRWPRVLACLDARMGQVYVASYARNDNGWARIGDVQVKKPDAVTPEDGRPWFGAGDGFGVFPDLAERTHMHDVDASIIPDAQSVAESHGRI